MIKEKTRKQLEKSINISRQKWTEAMRKGKNALENNLTEKMNKKEE